MNDLIQRLREEQFDGWSGDAVCVDAQLASEAADHIEAQNKLIEEMREALSEAKSWIGECYRAWAPDGVPVPDDVPYPSGHTSRMGHISAALSKSNPNTPERNDE